MVAGLGAFKELPYSATKGVVAKKQLDRLEEKMFDRQTMLAYLSGTPLEKLDEEFTVLTKRVHEYRIGHGGFTPKPIFGQCVGLGGQSFCVEIANVVHRPDGGIMGLAMKQREIDPLDPWSGLYHGTGAVIRPNDHPQDSFDRVTKEAWGGKHPSSEPVYLGQTLHYEPERWSNCRSDIWFRMVTPEDVKEFSGEWQIFTNCGDKWIINHHQQLGHQILRWLVHGDKRPFVDVRDYPVVR